MTDWFKPDPVSDTTPIYAGPPAGFLETVEAARKGYDAQRLSTARNYYAGRLGKDVVGALRQRGRTGFTGADGRAVRYGDDALRSDYILNPTVAPRIWQDVEAERERDPGFLKGIGSPDEFDAAILTARRRDFDESSEVLGRSSGMAGLAGELTGGILASFEDPLQIGAMAVTGGLPAGRLGIGVLQKLFGGRLAMGPATRIAGEALGNAGVNVLATAPTLPVTIARSEEIGVPLTGRDIAMELAGAAVAGGVLGGGASAFGEGVSAAGRAMSVRRMARELRKLERPLTPAEADALAVLDGAAADIAASPFPPTPEGDAAHGERLSEAVDALENDRPINPAVFEEPAPAVKDAAAIEAARAAAVVPGFDPTPYLAAMRRYAIDRKAGLLTPEAIGQALGIGELEAQAVLSRFASGDTARGLIIAPKVKKGQVQQFRRPPLRTGPVDLLTQIGDAGGIARTGLNTVYETPKPGARGRTFDKGHDLIGTIGQRLIPGSGPLLRKTGGMTLDQLGEFLHERGWFPAGRPTTADVIDLLDRAAREKVYNPDDAIDAMDSAMRDENAAWEADYRERVQTEAREMEIAEIGDDDMRAILTRVAAGDEPAAAIEAHINDQLDAAVMEARALLDDEDLAAVYLEDYDGPGGSDQTGGADRGGQPAAPRDAQQGGDGGAQPDGVAADTAGDPANDPPSAVDSAGGAKALESFDSPQGDGPAAQIESLEHDLRAALGRNAPPAKTVDEIAAALLTAFEREEPAPGVTQDRPASPLPPGRTSYSGPEQSGDIAPNASLNNAGAAPIGDTKTGSLGLDAVQAPVEGMTERQRAELAARMQQSTNTRADQQAVDQIAGGLFDAGRLDQADIFAMPDGSTATAQDLLAQFDADDAALKALRGCL